jgi:hypothetical protein
MFTLQDSLLVVISGRIIGRSASSCRLLLKIAVRGIPGFPITALLTATVAFMATRSPLTGTTPGEAIFPEKATVDRHRGDRIMAQARWSMGIILNSGC